MRGVSVSDQKSREIPDSLSYNFDMRSIGQSVACEHTYLLTLYLASSLPFDDPELLISSLHLSLSLFHLTKGQMDL